MNGNLLNSWRAQICAHPRLSRSTSSKQRVLEVAAAASRGAANGSRKGRIAKSRMTFFFGGRRLVGDKLRMILAGNRDNGSRRPAQKSEGDGWWRLP